MASNRYQIADGVCGKSVYDSLTGRVIVSVSDIVDELNRLDSGGFSASAGEVSDAEFVDIPRTRAEALIMAEHAREHLARINKLLDEAFAECAANKD